MRPKRGITIGWRFETIRHDTGMKRRDFTIPMDSRRTQAYHKEHKMNLPADIFPEDKADPTVKKQNEMSVEDTLGVIGHVRASTRKRQASLWRYLIVPDGEDGSKQIIATYGLPNTSRIEKRGTEWAIWAGDGEPSGEPFDSATVDTPYEEQRRILSILEKGDRLPSTVALLHDEAMDLYRMSKDAVFSEGVRMLLLRMSDMLHVEAGKIEVATRRQALSK